MRKLVVGAVIAALTVIAQASVAGACWIFGYQPETPAALRK